MSRDQVPAPQGVVQAVLEVVGAAAITLVVVDYVRFRWGWSPVDEAHRILRQLGH